MIYTIIGLILLGMLNIVLFKQVKKYKEKNDELERKYENAVRYNKRVEEELYEMHSGDTVANALNILSNNKSN